MLSVAIAISAFGPRAQADQAATPRAGPDTLARFWPFGKPTRSWSDDNKAGRTALGVTAVSRAPNELDLVFTHPLNPNVNNGTGFNVGRQRYCDNNGDPYIFLDAYLGGNQDGSVRGRHSIESSRLLVTPAGGAPIDLIKDGTYARCGSHGQPYLRWNTNFHEYRLQAWGSLAENPKDRWYWDVQVKVPVTAVEKCGRSSQAFPAVEVAEAWWTSFERKVGGWSIGSGSLGSDGLPDGREIEYGRTAYHGEGMPWRMVVSPNGGAMCAGEPRPGTDLPLTQIEKR